jgi:hypothetical protein
MFYEYESFQHQDFSLLTASEETELYRWELGQ